MSFQEPHFPLDDVYPDAMERRGARRRAIDLRRLSRLRRSAAWVVLAAPVLVVLSMDLLRRGDKILDFSGRHLLTYLGAAAESGVVWGALLYAACRRRPAQRLALSPLFVLLLTLCVGGQRYFHDHYNVYLNIDVSLFASNFMDSIVNQLFADIGNYLRCLSVPFFAALVIVFSAHKVVTPRRSRGFIAAFLAPLLLLGSLFIPTQHRQLQASTPDVLYLHALGGLIKTQLGFTDHSNKDRPRRRQSLPVVLEKAPATSPPNIVFLILESVRADAVCIEHDEACRRTPYTSALVPERFPFTEMRAQTSSTAISLAVLWSGVGPHESRDVLHTWPLLFDYARAAGYDTAFWTSQNMMFGNSRLWVENLGVSEFVSATDLHAASDLDMGAPEHLLASHVTQHLSRLQEPYLAVIQFSNAHYPYYVDPDGPMPFQPWETSKAPDANTAFFNYYLNAVHQQDRHVAEIVRHVRASASSPRTVIAYTSDHGEAFREHNQTGHTFSIFDEEIHVPAWIDAPASLLSEQQRKNLRDKKDVVSFHTDLTATLMDLMGVLDDPGVARYREKMLGVSLLREERNERPMPMTNCAGVWSCAFENWGYMKGNLKLEARAWDPGWHCYDVLSDRREERDLGVKRCGELEELALGTFGRLPGKRED